MKKIGDTAFWLKVLFLVFVLIAYGTMLFLPPVRVQSVGAVTGAAIESGFNGNSGFIAVKNRSIIGGTDGQTWVWIIQGDKAVKVTVKTGRSQGEYTEVISGLLKTDTYVENPSEKNSHRTEMPVSWRFDQ